MCVSVCVGVNASSYLPQSTLCLLYLYIHSWFIGNSAVLRNRNVPPVYTYHAVATMSGTVVFSSNTGGGLSVNQGLLRVEGHISFSNNVALHGGGLTLTDRAQVSAKTATPLLYM